MRLSELFATFGASWPVDLVSTAWPPDPSDAATLVAEIDNAIRVHDAVTDVSATGTVTITGKLKVETAPSLAELTSQLFPSIRFVFVPEIGWSSAFRVSLATDGTLTLQIDELPLELRLPSDLLSQHPDDDFRDIDEDIALSAGAEPSVIERSFALTLEAGGTLRLDPHLPISIGPCRLFGLPMRAVHDLHLIAAPGRAHKLLDWVVRPLDPENFPLDTGGLGFGGIEIDFASDDSPMKRLREIVSLRPDAELVLEDIVIPAMFLPPVPQHGTVGLRKTLSPNESIAEFLSFEDAPLKLPLGDSATFFLDQIFYKTPPADEDAASGLSLEGGIAFGAADEGGESWEVALGLIDGDLVRLSIARPLTPIGEDGPPLIHLDLWAIVIDIMRARFGVSVSGLQTPGTEFSDAMQALGDIVIREKPKEEQAGTPVEVETEDKKPFELAIVDLGWDRGEFSFDIAKAGKATLKLGPFALELHEIGLTAEDGATYINLSGGIRQKTDPFEGRVWFTRLRGRLAGNPDAPGFKLDGFGAELEIEDTVEIAVHGLFRNEVLPDGTRLREHGLGGKIILHVGGNEWGLLLNVFWGERTPPAGAEEERVKFLLFQIAFFGAIPMGPVELTRIEALYADRLLPRLEEEDPEPGELIYYDWLKTVRPTDLPESRDLLTAWKPENGAWAFGCGIEISFTGCGDVCRLGAFGLGFTSEEEAGLIIVVELKMFEAEEPIALGVFEYDFRRDAWVLQIQLELKLHELISNFGGEEGGDSGDGDEDEDGKLEVTLGGTITFANRPGLIAFGRIDDQETWIGAEISLQLSDLARLELRIAICFEWLEGEYVGGGFVFSLRVRADIKVIRLEGWGSLLVILKFMISGTNDFVARITFEMGFALILFGFLRFGISMNMLAEWLAHTPNFFVFRATFRLETPWFLPDVSVTVEAVSGSLAPAARGVVTGPLLEATGEGRGASRRLQLRRLDGQEGGTAPRLFSVDGLPASGTVWTGGSDPVPLDATIAIRFSPMLEDRLGIGEVNADLGRQVTGDEDMELTARYRLTGIEVRRRPVGTSAWTVAETITAPGGSRNFRWSWDIGTRTGGEVAPKTLLMNGTTPFTVGLSDPIADAEVLEENPDFPCCIKRPPDAARFDFCEDPLGPALDGLSRRLFYIRRGTAAPVRAACAAHVVRAPLPPGAKCDRIGAFTPGPGPAVTLTAEEDLARVALSFGLSARGMRVVVTVRDAEGELVDRIDLGAGGTQPFTVRDIAPGRPFRMVQIALLSDFDGQDHGEADLIYQALELDWIECVLQADQDRADADAERCDRIDDAGHGTGLSFLPGQDYEIALTTEIAIRHTSTEWESQVVTERVGFVTAGPPGLNATPEPGQELTPHVQPTRAGGAGLLYREESVHLVLDTKLTVFHPLPAGAGEAGFRLPVTLTVETDFEGKPENSPPRASYEGEEWFIANRGGTPLRPADILHDIILALSEDRGLLRYKALTEAGGGTCPPDDTWIEQRPRLGVEPFDAEGRAFWEPRRAYRAVMRPDGAPLVDRRPFVPADLTALAAATGTWSVSEAGALSAPGTASAEIGEADWDLYTLKIEAEIPTDGQVSAAVLVAPGNAGGGVRFALRRRADGSGVLSAEPVAGGATLGSEPLTGLGTALGLRVDVFADALRVRGGGKEITVPRGGQGPGKAALGARDAALRTLRVRGLEMFGFSFVTSRYESFAAHIASAEGAGAVETGPAAEDLFATVSSLAGEITAAMSPEAADADRDRVFNEAAARLAVPLREDPTRLYIERIGNGADRWLLLESPEPISLIEEVDITLRRRVSRALLPGGLEERLRQALGNRLGNILEPLDRRVAGRSLGAFGRLGRAAIPAPPPFRGNMLARADVALTVRMIEGRLMASTGGDTGGEIIDTNILSREDREALGRATIRFDPLGRIVDVIGLERIDWVEIGLMAIQNGDATRALLLPRSAGALPAGAYRLDFAITRRWFDTLDPPGPGNAYMREATAEFTLL